VQLDTMVERLGNDVINKPNSAGLSIGIYHAGQTFFYNFGTTERGQNERPAENSVYEIGSLTKTFVSLLLAKAVIDKKILLEDDIRKYLDGDYPNLEYDHQPIRVINLANTTSGLPDVLPAVPDEMTKAPSDSIPFIIERFYGALTEKDFFQSLRSVKLDTVPGFYPKHSNAAAQLLGYIMERIYKKPLYRVLQEYVLSPVNMKNTSFANPSNFKMLLKGYNAKGNQAPYLSQSYMQASGGLRSSAADLMKYAAFFLDQKSPLAQLALKKTIGIDAGTNKVVSIDPRDSIDETVYSASLNWWQYHPAKGNERIWSDGGTPGFCSYIVFYPEVNLGIVLLSNKSDAAIFGELPDIANRIFKVFSPG